MFRKEKDDLQEEINNYYKQENKSKYNEQKSDFDAQSNYDNIHQEKNDSFNPNQNSQFFKSAMNYNFKNENNCAEPILDSDESFLWKGKQITRNHARNQK